MQRASRIVMLLIVVMSLALSAPLTRAQDGYTPTITWDDCPFNLPPGEYIPERIECGYLTVPQDRSDPGGKQIELAVVVLHSQSTNPAPDPILYLEGGPGGSAITGLDSWLESPFRARRDIILLDQRGMGYSFPRLYCYEVEDLEYAEAYAYMDDEAFLQAEEEALRACKARLESEEGVDLHDYNSAASAADVADLRVALGYEQWNLYGISYGTRLALTVMRDYPAGVRSVVLDSTYPPVVDAYEEDPANAYRVFRLLFDHCAADAACNAAYPGLENTFYRLVDRLNQNPAYVPDWGEELYGDELVGLMYEFFYDGQMVPYLPLMIAELDQGTTDTFLALYDGLLPGVEEAWPEIDEDDLGALFLDEFFYLLDDLDDAQYEAALDILYAIEEVDRVALADAVAAIFAPDDADYLIQLLDEMFDEEFEWLALELFAEDVSDTDGAYNAFECNEEVPFNDWDEALDVAAELPAQIGDPILMTLDEQITICAAWDSGVAGVIEDQAITSDIPTLVLAGEYDPVTPPAWGQLAASTLPNSFFFEFSGVGHGAIDGGDCPVNMALAFFDAPTTAPDSSCIAAMSGSAFVLP